MDIHLATEIMKKHFKRTPFYRKFIINSNKYTSKGASDLSYLDRAEEAFFSAWKDAEKGKLALREYKALLFKKRKREYSFSNESRSQSYMPESSYGRTRELFYTTGFAIISAYVVQDHMDDLANLSAQGGSRKRARILMDRDEPGNLDQHNGLKDDIRTLGYGYVELQGNYPYDPVYVEKLNSTVSNINLREESILIPAPRNIDTEEGFSSFRSDMVLLGMSYNQESIIIVYPEFLVDDPEFRVHGVYMAKSGVSEDENWGKKIVIGDGDYGSSSFLKGAWGSSRKEDGQEDSEEQEDYFLQKGSKTAKPSDVDVSGVKFPDTKKYAGRDRGKTWHFEGHTVAEELLNTLKGMND